MIPGYGSFDPVRLACCLLLITFVVLEWHTVVRGALPTVVAVLETKPSLDDDDADDPAIWVHPKDATKSGALVQHVAPDARGQGWCSTARATTTSI